MESAIYIFALVYFCSTLTVKGSTFGNDIKGGKVLKSLPRSFILTHIPLPAGRATGFHIYSAVSGSRVRLQVWRPYWADEYLLVEEFNHTLMENGPVEVSLASKEVPLMTRQGDVIGFTTETSEVGIAFNTVPFKNGSFVISKVVLKEDSFPTPGRLYTFTGHFFDKLFSISIDIIPENSLVTDESHPDSTVPTAENIPGTKIKNSSINGDSTRPRCDFNNGGCHHLCEEGGEEVKCSCRLGYKLDVNSKSCSDDDECKRDTNSCPTESECINTPGSFTCATAIESTAKDLTKFDINTLTQDPKMIVMLGWMLVLTLLVIIAMVIAVISHRRRLKFDYGANISYHNNQNRSKSRRNSGDLSKY